MPIDYHIDTSHRLIVTTAKGILTQYELLDQQRRVRDDPEFDSTFWRLHDISNADVTEFKPEYVEAFAELAIPKKGTRSAIVVGSAKADELAQMFGDLRERTGEQIRIFGDLSAARAWLGLSQEPEHWRAPRKTVSNRVRIRTGLHKLSGELINISRSGALLKCPTYQPFKGRTLKIEIQREGASNIDLTGTVVRVTQNTFATQFQSVTKELEQLLKSLS